MSEPPDHSLLTTSYVQNTNPFPSFFCSKINTPQPTCNDKTTLHHEYQRPQELPGRLASSYGQPRDQASFRCLDRSAKGLCPFHQQVSKVFILDVHFILTESRAAFTGSRVTLRQVSPESESIFDFIIELYNATSGDWKALQEKAGVADQDLSFALEYFVQFLGNCGNYKGFGDSKFVPRCAETIFDALAATSPKANEFYKATKGAIFSSNNTGMMSLGYPPNHVTEYYPDSKSITKDEITAVSDFLEKKGLLVVCHAICITYWFSSSRADPH